MSATSHGLAAGLILGIVFVLLAQQLGYLVLSSLGAALLYLVGGAVVGAIVGALLGRLLGRRYRAPPARAANEPPS